MSMRTGLMAIVAIVVVGIGSWFVFRNNRDDQSMMVPTESMRDDGTSRMNDDAVMKEDSMESDGEMMESDDMMESGDTSSAGASMQDASMVDAKDSGAYADYTKSVFDQANGKRRILFFYANWCPTCRPADVDIRENISELPADVIVFRVNYNDTAKAANTATIPPSNVICIASVIRKSNGFIKQTSKTISAIATILSEKTPIDYGRKKEITLARTTTPHFFRKTELF